jgi:hypothetical protein
MDKQHEEDYHEPRQPGGRLSRLTLRDLAFFGICLMWAGVMFALLIAVIAVKASAGRH